MSSCFILKFLLLLQVRYAPNSAKFPKIPNAVGLAMTMMFDSLCVCVTALIRESFSPIKLDNDRVTCDSDPTLKTPSFFYRIKKKNILSP